MAGLMAPYPLDQGQGEDIKSKLIARGAQATLAGDPSPIRTTNSGISENGRGWSVRVDRIDAGDTTLDPSFSDAIYENILEELAKSKQFQRVSAAAIAMPTVLLMCCPEDTGEGTVRAAKRDGQ